MCCYSPLPNGYAPEGTGLKRSYCCPKGSQCSDRGCVSAATNQTEHKYDCGPVQGENCPASFVCAPGPTDWPASSALPRVVVVGDSVSLGWTPVLKALINATHFVTHSPASGDGGARSTSSALHCMPYLTSTALAAPMRLQSRDTVLVNFGLHDYNLGLAGVPQYAEELKAVLGELQRAFAPAKLIFVLTTPAHNTPTGDDVTVQALNSKAAALAQSMGWPTIDLYTPIMKQCGPVPFRDTGPTACEYCAPDCKRLSVHYGPEGYAFIARTIARSLK